MVLQPIISFGRQHILLERYNRGLECGQVGCVMAGCILLQGESCGCIRRHASALQQTLDPFLSLGSSRVCARIKMGSRVSRRGSHTCCALARKELYARQKLLKSAEQSIHYLAQLSNVTG